MLLCSFINFFRFFMNCHFLYKVGESFPRRWKMLRNFDTVFSQLKILLTVRGGICAALYVSYIIGGH